MGRKYEPAPGLVAWRLEHCEEVVLLDAWREAKGRIPPTEHWTLDFNYRLFEKGDPVSERHLVSLNRHLRRIGAEEVWFEETNPSDYARFYDKDQRRKDRRAIIERLESMNEEHRADLVANARTSMEILEPAHRTYEEYKKLFPRSLSSSPVVVPAASVPVIAADAPSIQELPTAPPTRPSIPVELAMKLLEHTTDSDTKNNLVRMVVSAFSPQMT